VREEDSMRAYVITTGMVFGLVVLAHVWRAVEEGAHVAGEPVFLVSTVLAAALCAWAWRLLATMRRA
jgi:hypothetical protein